MTATPFFDDLAKYRQDHGQAELTPEQPSRRQAFYTAPHAIRGRWQPNLSGLATSDQLELYRYA